MMRCDRSRARIQDWLDEPGAPAMPAEIREHIRDCTDCRSFIKRWNTIEAGLMTMREQAPRLSPDFGHSLQARLHAGPVRRERVRTPVKWSFAIAGASSAAVLILLTLYLLGARQNTLPSANGPSYANGRSSGGAINTDSPSSFPSTLPLANTGR
jgi:predicted anti-sigma-YlaC factor YlaD